MGTRSQSSTGTPKANQQINCDHCSDPLSGLSADQVKVLLKLPNGVSLLCDNCKTLLVGLENRVKALEAKQNDVEGLAERVIAAVLPKILDSFESRMEEKIEAASKKLNLVAIGITENSENDCLDSAIKSACDKLSIDSCDVITTFRDGKSREGRPRIAKIQFKNQQSRHKFLVGFRGIRGGVAGAETAWVRPDLTFRQREADRELRAELNTRRTNGEKVKIFHGKIVPNE